MADALKIGIAGLGTVGAALVRVLQTRSNMLAVACGRPIVAMLDGEGARVLRESEAALTGPSGDAQALASNVLALHRMPREQRELMGRAGRKYYARHFERDRLMNQLEQWFEEARKHGNAADAASGHKTD